MPNRRLTTTLKADLVSALPESLEECETLLSEVGYSGCKVWGRDDNQLIVSYRGKAYSLMFDFGDLVSITLVDGWPA